MFTKYEFTIPDKNDNFYDNIICKKCKSPSSILSSNITFTKPLFNNNIRNGTHINYSNFIKSEDYTNNIKGKYILPCNDSNCITKNIFNIMILCCNLVYSLINQTRVNIFDYFYTTNLIEELCIFYTLLNKSNINEQIKKQINKYIENIIKKYYSIMFYLIDHHAGDTNDNDLNNDIETKLKFLNISLKNFLESNDNIPNSDYDPINLVFLKELLNKLKKYLNELNKNILNELNKNIYLKIQKVTVKDYIIYFEEAYKIISILLNNFDELYKYIYKYDYTNENTLMELIKLRTYLLLMFTYKIRFISFNDVDNKGGRQAEFFISNILRDFYNYYYIDNKFDSTYNNFIKSKYKEILKNILQYNFFYTETYENILKDNTIMNMNIYANNNIITLEYYYNNIKELFRPFEKMYNINECSYNYINNININDGKIGGDLIYLHECYSKDNSNKYSLNSNSICIIVDSKAYQDITFYTENKIDKTIIQCYLYAQYVKECYKKNIYDDNNLYLSVVNPIYGSYYVYKYNYVHNKIYTDSDIIKELQNYKLFNKKEEKRRERKEKNYKITSNKKEEKKEKEEKKVRTLK